MNISYNEQLKVFKLDTENTSYCMAIVDEEQFLGHAYYGSKVSDEDVSYLLRTKENPYVPSVNNRDRGSFMDAFPFEFPGSNSGDFRESAIEIEDRNGVNVCQFNYLSHQILDGKPGIPGLPATFGTDKDCKTLEITLQDSFLQTQVILSYSVFQGIDAIAKSVRVINKSENTLYLRKIMSSCIDMDDDTYELISLHGSWARERHIDRRPLGHGKTSVGSTRGESSHQEHPFIALAAHNTTQNSGEVYGFHFVYSGNFLAQVEKNQFDLLRVQMGIHPKNFKFALEPEDTFYAPEVILTFSDEGLGGMSRRYHDLYRQHLIRSPYKDKKRPILINNWEATYFDFNTDKLLAIARNAKAAGIEMLVMDDGWFGVRNDDNTSLGDWIVNEKKLQGGLTNLVNKVNEIGLKFGIWFEPEMISPDSDLYRVHPDWAIAVPERTPCRMRNQYVLDITRKEVRDYVFESVAKILRSANIEYVKWDMNRQLTDLYSLELSADRQGELSHRYVLAVYELQERLLREFPDLLIENCSGGGARFDPGMLYYSPQIWCSDDTDAIERLSIQEGTALIYPLSSMGAHVSDCPNHTVGRNTPFETRGHVALAGTFGYELDITKIPEEDREMIPKQVEMYHKYNDLVRNGDYYRYASYSENHSYDCYAVISKDKAEALITYVQVMNRANMHSRKVKILGLDPNAVYRIENTEQRYFGDTLIHAGLIIQNKWGDFKSELIHLVKEE